MGLHHGISRLGTHKTDWEPEMDGKGTLQHLHDSHVGLGFCSFAKPEVESWSPTKEEASGWCA
eukprot:scaffold843_cov330-Pavlova_lutheri.AAC.25